MPLYLRKLPGYYGDVTRMTIFGEPTAEHEKDHETACDVIELCFESMQPGTPIGSSEYRCVWPERLTLDVDSRGGSFSQRWQVYAESWVRLPGDQTGI